MSGYILNENTEYALRVLLYLMPYGTVAPMTEAAGYMQVPRERLRTIGNKLKEAAIVKYVQGSYGGYMLSKDPAQIKLYDIIMCMDRSKSDLEQKESKIIMEILCEAQRNYLDRLKKISLSDLYAKVNANES